MNKLVRGGITLPVLAVLIWLAGCTSHKKQVQYEEELSKRNQEISTLQSDLQTKQEMLAQRERELKRQADALLAAEKAREEALKKAASANHSHSHETGSQATLLNTSVELMPPNPKPGHCYARVFIPPNYKYETEQVLIRDASEKIEVVPAKYEWVEEKVLVKAASEKIEVVPATYKWVEEKVLVREASLRTEEVPAEYETVTERVIDQPAHTVWKKGAGPIQKIDHATGEIMCLVEVPATYKTIEKRVLKSAAHVREIKIPAEYEVVKKRVVDVPAAINKIQIPAEYDMVKVRKVAMAPQENRTKIPAEYRTVEKKVKVSEGRMSWEEILCETNLNSDIAKQIQTALKDRGFDPGPIDGVIGSETMGAVKRFQEANRLAIGNLTMETLHALEVNP